MRYLKVLEARIQCHWAKAKLLAELLEAQWQAHSLPILTSGGCQDSLICDCITPISVFLVTLSYLLL